MKALLVLPFLAALLPAKSQIPVLDIQVFSKVRAYTVYEQLGNQKLVHKKVFFDKNGREQKRQVYTDGKLSTTVLSIYEGKKLAKVRVKENGGKTFDEIIYAYDKNSGKIISRRFFDKDNRLLSSRRLNYGLNKITIHEKSRFDASTPFYRSKTMIFSRTGRLHLRAMSWRTPICAPIALF